MEEFPNSDEEFELMYGDDLEVLREQGDIERTPKKSRKSLDFTPYSKETNTTTQDSFENSFTPLVSDETPHTNKRTIEDLFGDIDDLLYENQTKSKKYKGDDHEADYALIEHILELRKLAKESGSEIQNKDYTKVSNRDSNNLSYTVPKYPFVGVTRHDGRRVYIRFHSEQFEAEERQRIVQKITLTNGFNSNKQMWDDAKKLIENQLDNAEVETEAVDPFIDDKELWVDLYKPRKYFELLSDESTNRIMLRWIKLWDKVVFNRKPKLKIIKNKEQTNVKMQELHTNLDEDGRPHHKVALLCGTPGLGKTTLAHMVARHAGYSVMEINASDDRSTDAFKTALENGTQMRSVIDKERRPNCLIFDEIDGAPSASIDYLVKFITGTAVKNKKNQKKGNILKRPIICICNDAYVPSLRPLRQIAFIVNFPSTSNTRLAERLMEIARRQQVKTDLGAMLALADKSRNDIRSCLSVLHFYKSQNRPVNLSDVYKANVGQKDMQKGLFSVWQDIFFIERPKAGSDHKQEHTLKDRTEKVLNSVSSFGDYDKIAQGIFENYPHMKYKNSNLNSTCQALDWFCYGDVLSNDIHSSQNYSLSSYLQYASVAWHFVFSSRSWQKLQYPNVGYETRTKQNRQKAIVAELMRGMQPSIRSGVHPTSLILDILPLLSTIIVPSFRPINLHLYTEEEKKSLDHVVNVMIDYNLNYVQERTADGTYAYKLDPNIEENVSFLSRKTLSYCNKQLIAKEIETVKMRGRVQQQQQELPNHLQALKAKTVETA
ncbi:chromosome transmission fidelity protein 18 -like, partial [Asbolus verrucosus]